jgi:hypothetical protein
LPDEIFVTPLLRLMDPHLTAEAQKFTKTFAGKLIQNPTKATC